MKYKYDKSSIQLYGTVCTSNVLLCGYITGIHDKRTVTSCVTRNVLQSIGILQLLTSILSTDYFATIYAADNTQLNQFLYYGSLYKGMYIYKASFLATAIIRHMVVKPVIWLLRVKGLNNYFCLAKFQPVMRE